MAYVTLSEYRDYMQSLSGGTALGTSMSDDAFLTNLLTSAQLLIEDTTHRRFEATTLTHRYVESDLSVQDKQILILDDDLLSVTTLVNGDGTTLNSTDYFLLPRNHSPKSLIELKSNFGWQFSNDGEIVLTGTWGKTAAASADVKRVTCRLAFLEFQRRNATGEVTVLGEGAFTYQAQVPPDLSEWLERQRRRRPA